MSGEQLQQQNANVQQDDKGEERLRDLHGRLAARVDKLEKSLSDKDEEIRSLKEELEMVSYPDRSDQFDQYNTAPPPISPPQQMGIWRDPKTGMLYQVPVASMSPEPAVAPSRQSPQISKDRIDQLQATYNRICNDLEFHGKMHPDDAQALATDIMHRHERTGKSVEAIQREMSKSNPLVRNVLKAKVAELADYTGAKVTFDDAVNDHAQVQSPTTVTETPAQAPAANQAGVVFEETPDIRPPAQRPAVPATNVVPTGLSTERNNVPPAVDTSKTASQKYETVSELLDNNLSG